MKGKEILTDNFGDRWEVIQGKIKVGDMAYSHDTGDVYYVDDEEDLYLFNNIASKVQEAEEVCETCGGEGEIWHSDYYCDMAYTTPCHECNDE